MFGEKFVDQFNHHAMQAWAVLIIWVFGHGSLPLGTHVCVQRRIVILWVIGLGPHVDSSKRTFPCVHAMSALPPKADMCGATRDVRFGPKADMWLKSNGHSL